MKRLLLLALLLTGCGEETKGVTATSTRTATPTPTVKPAPPAERARAELRNYLQENTRDMSGRCVPADELVMDAIAAVDCDFRQGPRGGYLLFDSKSDLEDYFGLVTASSNRSGARSARGTRGAARRTRPSAGSGCTGAARARC